MYLYLFSFKIYEESTDNDAIVTLRGGPFDPFTIRATTNLAITFEPDDSVNFRGFHAFYTIEKCKLIIDFTISLLKENMIVLFIMKRICSENKQKLIS